VTYQTFTLTQESSVVTITLSRPEKRNAISTQMIEELLTALTEIESTAARAVIVTGSGTAFCSGMDLDGLKNLAKQSPTQNL